MDDELRALERTAYAHPGDLPAGRAYVEALRRRGERRVLFSELGRLARRGDVDARRELEAWVPWSGERGHGATGHRECAAVRSAPAVDVLELPPDAPGRWQVLGVTDHTVVLCAPTRAHGMSRSLPAECVVVDTDRLVVTHRRTLLHDMGTCVLLHGDDLLWLGGGALHIARVDDAAARPTRCELPRGAYALLDAIWDAALVLVQDERALFWTDLVAVLLPGSREGPRWTHRPRGAPTRCVRGQPLVEVHVDERGEAFHPGVPDNFHRPGRIVLEQLDASTGAVIDACAPIDARLVQVLSWDDDALLLGLDRRGLALRGGLSGDDRWRWDLAGDDGLPLPLLTPREVVLVGGPVGPSLSFTLQVLDRSTGRLRWSAPFPFARAWREVQAGTFGAGTFGRLTGAIASADDTLYVALDSDDDLTIRAHDLSSGALRFEARAPVVACGDALANAFNPRAVQLVVQAEALLALVGTGDGGELVRIR